MAAESNSIGNGTSTISYDQEKFLAAKLLQRSMLRLVAASICDKVQMPKGAGTSFYFVRYARMNVPMATVAEGESALTNSSFALEQVTGTLDQWADVITLSDVVQLTAKHPIVQQANELLADNAQRVIDREVQVVWMAGTNVIYGDASVTTRATITNTMKVTDALINKARVTLIDQGAPPRDGPSKNPMTAGAGTGMINGGAAYVAVAGPQVIADVIVTSSAYGSWASVATYNNAKALYNAEVGTWLGIRWVETNFIPKFTMLGNTTAAVTSTNAFGTNTPVVTAVDGGGSLTSSTTYYFKVTRKSLQRGFEEDISIIHSMSSTATSNNESFTFNFSSLTAGYVYNLYFGSANADASLGLVQANIAVGTTVTVTTAPALTTTPPPSLNTSSTPTAVHPVYIHGASSCAWVGLQDLKMFITGDVPTTDNPALLRKKLAYKFMAKTVILDQTRLLRLEVAATN